VNVSSLRNLEFAAIRALLAGHAGSAAGRSLVEDLQPKTTPSAVRDALDLTQEAVELLRGQGRQPYHDLPDLRDTLPKAKIAGLHLEPASLADVASFIEGSAEIARCVTAFEGTPRLSRLASAVRDSTSLSEAIRRAILPSGEVADDASPKLAETRRALVRLRGQLHAVMESFLRARDAERVLQDNVITTRNDRYVLIVKAEQRSQLPGIIHSTSGSGASLFVEPLPAVELNNDIVALGDEERREVVRILEELTARVGERAEAILADVEILARLDLAQAMALLARDMEAVKPEVSDDLGLELRDARHPLLLPLLTERLGLPRRASRAPVGVTIRIGPDAPALVISGPNTGGKTVALKTVGLLCIMAQCGLHLPVAAGSSVPVFRRIFADIGDDQSIAANLSTFSAHLAAIVEMARDLAQPALVLLDEVGAGTDPTEGGALGVAIVEHFRIRGAMVVATTHHGLMKAYAQATPGVACASFGYTPNTYEPTYRLTLGAAGRSLAIEMAERLGLPADLLADARSRLDDRQLQAEALLKRLESEEARLEAEKERITESRRAVRVEAERLRTAEREIAARKRADAEAFGRALRKAAEDASRRAADAIQKAVERVEGSRKSTAAAGAQARAQAARAILEARDEALRSVGIEPEPDVADRPVAVGERVRVRTLGVVGQLQALHGLADADVVVAGKRLRVPRAELQAVAGRTAPSRAAAPVAPDGLDTRPAVPAEINLVGLRVDEAVPSLDKLLDDAALSERRELRVIHGFGEGKLRRAVAELLTGHPHVASFRRGDGREGGGGVTIVELKG
jgi:DNA mismatch repair protein MutS2